MKIIVKDNGLKAYIKFTKEDVQNKITAADIRAHLNQSGVRHGVNLSGWESIYDNFVRGQLKDEMILVAEGTPPIAGEDGYVEYLFDTGTHLAPKIKNGDKVDFRDLDLVKNVRKGEILARLHPPKPGKPGIRVTGEEVSAPDGKPAKLPGGQNVEPSSENPSVLVAKIDGHVRLTRSKEVVVEEMVKVRGDVDYSTGNIKAITSVLIQGDVKSGFEVEAGGDIVIKGTVEDAKVVAGGNIQVKKGFMGHRKGIINSGNNAHIQHVDNQKIVAENDVIIDEEAVQSEIIAGKSLILKAKKASIIGGMISVGEFISAYNIGNEQHTRTEIFIGDNPHLVYALREKEKQYKSVQENLGRVKQGIFMLVRHRLDHGTLPSHQDQVLSELMSARKKCENMIEKFTNEIETLKKQLSQQKTNIRIEVRGKLFPGTIIRFKSRVYPVFRPIGNIVITADDF